MLAAYVNLKKAFHSVHGNALWEVLRLRGISARIISLLYGLYSGTESVVNCGGGMSSFFPVSTEVRQICVLAPLLFKSCLYLIFGRVIGQSHCRASTGNI